MLRRVLVKFKDRNGNGYSKPYSYLTDLNLEVDDIVVVETGDHFGVGIVVSTVGLAKFHIDVAHKWVVQKVDLTAHADRVEKRARSMEIKTRLDALKDEYNEMLVYQAMATNNPEVAALLQELQNIEQLVLPETSTKPVESTQQ